MTGPELADKRQVAGDRLVMAFRFLTLRCVSCGDFTPRVHCRVCRSLIGVTFDPDDFEDAPPVDGDWHCKRCGFHAPNPDEFRGVFCIDNDAINSYREHKLVRGGERLTIDVAEMGV